MFPIWVMWVVPAVCAICGGQLYQTDFEGQLLTRASCERLLETDPRVKKCEQVLVYQSWLKPRKVM